jgi:hypothetical protein
MKVGFATSTIRAVPQKKLRLFVRSFAQQLSQMLFDHSEKMALVKEPIARNSRVTGI